MSLIHTSVACSVHNSFRVQQVAGMFDLPRSQTLRETFSVEVPSLDEPWEIGAIIGPSGSGKSTIARASYGDCIFQPGQWPRAAAVIDGFPDLPIKQITRTLTAVGFGSPPSWLKPYVALSTGEQFRCELAQALLRGVDHRQASTASRLKNRTDQQDCPTVVFDEFTSVVDRTVAKVCSAAISRAIRKRQVRARFVAVSCHHDIVPWLSPDWVVDMTTSTLTRGRLRPGQTATRPPLQLEIIEAKHAVWKLFARHHYLSGSLSRAAKVYLATWNDQPVALCAVVAMYGYPGRRRIHRLVTLPDFQGIGIGSRLLDHIAGIETDLHERVNITSSHPAVISHCRGSPHWRTIAVRQIGSATRQRKEGKAIRGAQGRTTVSFEYCA